MSAPESSKPRASRRARAVGRLLDRAGAVLGSRRAGDGDDADEPGRIDPRVARDHLIIEAQQATYRQLHSRFKERTPSDGTGLASALDALDAMWENVRQLRVGAPHIVQTLASPHDGVQDRLSRFYTESTGLLEDAIRHVFAEDLGHLAVPPARMAVIVRVMLEGLVVELAQARTPDDVMVADQAYTDMRALFERFVLLGEGTPDVAPVELEEIVLPW